MKKNQSEIKNANRKAIPLFILLIAIGGVVGYFTGYYAMKLGIYKLSDELKRIGEYFSINIAPYLMLATAVIFPSVCIPLYLKAKKLIREWDGEDETIYDKAEGYISVVVWISGSCLILGCFLIAATYSEGFSIFDNIFLTIKFFMAIATFLAILFEAILIQQKSIDLVKTLNPEKKGSVYDIKFHKKWLESCDEAEKSMICQSAFKAYRITNSVCSTLAIVLAIGALVFDIGFLPSLSVCIIWIVNQSAYCKEAIKLSNSSRNVL